MAHLRPTTSAAQLPATQEQGVSCCWCPTSCRFRITYLKATWGRASSLLYFSIFPRRRLLDLVEFGVRPWEGHNFLLPSPSQLLCCHLFEALSSRVCDSCDGVWSGKSPMKAVGGCSLSSLPKCSYIMDEKVVAHSGKSVSSHTVYSELL